MMSKRAWAPQAGVLANADDEEQCHRKKKLLSESPDNEG